MLDAEGNLKCMNDVAIDLSKICTVRVCSFDSPHCTQENALDGTGESVELRVASNGASIVRQALAEARLNPNPSIWHTDLSPHPLIVINVHRSSTLPYHVASPFPSRLVHSPHRIESHIHCT